MNEPRTNYLLEVSELMVAYRSVSGSEVVAVNHASFVIKPGETVGLLGESGCGKSTIALSLLGLLPPDSASLEGIIRFNGRELQELNDRELEKIRGAQIALIPQDSTLALSPVKRVGEQLADVLQAHRPWKRGRCREGAEQLLHSVHLDDAHRVLSSYPFQLSGGQLQRVVIAQALACEPSLVIADEPTSPLDSIVRAEILSLFQELKEQRGMTLLLISHEPEILARLADRILIMEQGRIIEEGKFTQLRDHPVHAFTRELLAAMRRPTRAMSRKEPACKSGAKISDLVIGGSNPQ
jgi:ABC-type glutathione transport system ATPase component